MAANVQSGTAEISEEAWHHHVRKTREERQVNKQKKCRKQIIQVSYEDEHFRREKNLGI